MSNANALSETYAPFLDLITDVKPWLQIPASDTRLDTNLQLITEMACVFVQEFCGRPFIPTKYDWRFDGWANWNGAYIMLPRSPVLEIVSVIEYWGVAGPHVLSESTPTAQVDGWQLVPETGRLNRVFPGNVSKPWFPGERNIEVVWIAGYNPIPATVRVATLELISEWFRNTQQNDARPGGGQIGDYDPSATAGVWEGVPQRVTALLSGYIRVGIG